MSYITHGHTTEFHRGQAAQNGSGNNPFRLDYVGTEINDLVGRNVRNEAINGIEHPDEHEVAGMGTLQNLHVMSAQIEPHLFQRPRVSKTDFPSGTPQWNGAAYRIKAEMFYPQGAAQGHNPARTSFPTDYLHGQKPPERQHWASKYMGNELGEHSEFEKMQNAGFTVTKAEPTGE